MFDWADCSAYRSYAEIDMNTSVMDAAQLQSTPGWYAMD